jgi:hypothetical protein
MNVCQPTELPYDDTDVETLVEFESSVISSQHLNITMRKLQKHKMSGHTICV